MAFAAARAYKQALATLATLTASPSSRAFETHHPFSWSTGNSFLSSFLPNPQGQGPLGSALRIAIKLRHQSWLPRFLSSRFSQESGRRRSDEELKGRAIKVMDLLQHAADLGHLDALFVLGKLSLVLLSLSLCPQLWAYRILAPTNPAFHCRPCTGIYIFRDTRRDYRERDVAKFPCFLLRKRLPKYRASRSGDGPAVLHVCCAWRRQGCSNGTRVSILDRNWCCGKL
jgi:hypothetical protein